MAKDHAIHCVVSDHNHAEAAFVTEGIRRFVTVGFNSKPVHGWPTAAADHVSVFAHFDDALGSAAGQGQQDKGEEEFLRVFGVHKGLGIVVCLKRYGSTDLV